MQSLETTSGDMETHTDITRFNHFGIINVQSMDYFDY